MATSAEDILKRLVEWERVMGGFEAPVWREAEALVTSNGKPAKPIRIKATDRLGNVAYVFPNQKGDWRCVLSSGLGAAFSYAGLEPEREVEFALEDAPTAKDALAVCRKFGTSDTKYELV